MEAGGRDVLAALLGVEAAAGAPGTGSSWRPTSTRVRPPGSTAMSSRDLLAEGGPTSHAAILARSSASQRWSPPAGRARHHRGTAVLIDGSTGEVTVAPDAERAPARRHRRRRRAGRARAAAELAREPAVPPTARGRSPPTWDRPTRRQPPSLPAPTASGCSGPSSCSWVGGPTRRRRAGSDLPGRRRDAGGTTAGGTHLRHRRGQAGAVRRPAGRGEPFLGVRGLRLGLRNTELLATQLRAIARVAADHPISPDVPHGEHPRRAAGSEDHGRPGVGGHRRRLPGGVRGGGDGRGTCSGGARHRLAPMSTASASAPTTSPST